MVILVAIYLNISIFNYYVNTNRYYYSLNSIPKTTPIQTKNQPVTYKPRSYKNK